MGLLRKTGLLVVFLLFSFSSSAEESFYLGVGIGVGDLDIDGSSFPGANFVVDDISGDVVVAEYLGGYRFENNWTLDLGYEGYNSFDILLIGDVIDLKAVRIGGGYHFPSENRFSAFVKGGVTFWDLQFKESFFLNPGPEETASRNGSNAFFQIGGEIRVFNSLITRLTYDIANNDFGDSRAGKLWFGGRF